MQNLPKQRLCVRCKATLQHNQPFCSICGTQQPEMTMPVPKKSGLSARSYTTISSICLIVGSCALCGLFGAIMQQSEKQQTSVVNATSIPSVNATSTSSARTTSTVSVTSTPSARTTSTVKVPPTRKQLGSHSERLQVAADIRNYLKDQDIPALVVAYGTKLYVTYTYALAEYDPHENFFKQQGKQGLRKIANAGFETLEIEAYDKNNQIQKRTFSLLEYRK